MLFHFSGLRPRPGPVCGSSLDGKLNHHKMVTVSSYGSFPSLPRDLGRTKRNRVYNGLLIATAGSVVASVLLLVAVANRYSSTVLYWHGSYDPGILNWDGCGAGGNCGGVYHWDSESYSPFSGEAVRMSFTHDHTSYANWFNETNGTWVTGAHLVSPFSGTRNASFWNTSVYPFQEQISRSLYDENQHHNSA